MDIKELLGDKYKEDLSHEELLELLKEVEVVSKEELMKQKGIADKNSKEAKEWKDKFKNTLTEKEQKELEDKTAIEKLQADYEKLLKEKTVAENVKNLIGLGYNEELALEVGEAMANGDTAKVFEGQRKFVEEYKKTVTAETLKNTKTPNNGGEPKKMTKAEFSKLTLAERQKIFDEDEEEFMRLIGE